MSAIAQNEVQDSSPPHHDVPQHAATTAATPQDLQLIWKWNEAVPETVDGRVHDLITQRAQLQPDEQAVCAWDGNWSYRELDERSTNLAHRLVHMGIGPDIIVPLCFPKSKWTPIAMLAVMKAGGASVVLETSLPSDRLYSIVQQVEPILILSSSMTTELAAQLTARPVIIVDEASTTPDATSILPEVQPWKSLYLVFTSGSTGTPKGTIITHSNFCSAIHHQRAILGYSSSSRVYNFTKHSFDVTWSDFIFTMTAGGCLCIPLQQDAMSNLAGSILAYNANFINITPSVGSMIRPSDLKGTLKQVVFAGEALPSHQALEWAQHTRVINLYGPAECTVGITLAVISDIANIDSSSATIGHGIGSCSWIVDPSCHDSLVPVGAVGELLTEGPVVGAGYYSNAEKTAAVFIENPKWLLAGPPGGSGRPGRLYKTGDLVRYEANGQLAYLGRKDLQVKINGQRVELGDIEHHVRAHLAESTDVGVAAELVTPRDSDRSLLTAFLQISTPAARQGRDGLEGELRRVTDGLNNRLAAQIPAYMIPSVYIPLEVFPKNANGKMDRRKLREICETSSMLELMAWGSPLPEKKEPTTLLEFRLQGLWSSVLGLDISNIGVNDSFLRLGGDSIAAMRLAGAAREHGLSLTVADIFNHSVLHDMAGVVGELSATSSFIQPYELLKDHTEVGVMRSQVAGACGVNAAEIEDVFSCTPLQEGLIALTAKNPGDYVSRHVFQLQPTVDIKRLKRAWEEVVAMTPILRTRIVNLNQQGLVQVVLNQPIRWASKGGEMDLAKYQKEDGELTTGMRQDEATKFWLTQFEGSEAQTFPNLPSPRYQPRSDKMLTHAISELQWPKMMGVTASTMLRAAWAIITSCYTNANETVFGVTVSGRQAALPGVEQMTGPTIATVPVRIVLDKRKTIQELLLQIQTQVVDMTAFEQTGLQRIRRISPEAERACDFQTLLVIQPAADQKEKATHDSLFAPHSDNDHWSLDDEMAEFRTYSLSLECYLEDQGVVLLTRFDSAVLADDQVAILVRQLEHVVRQLCSAESAEAKLEDILLVGQEDLQQMWHWNSVVPDTADGVVHDLITMMAKQQPEAQAVCAWDGDWTYRELDELSTRLAHHLVTLGVGPEVIVPLCIEKSKWMPVAMMAVMKAGGASVAVDYAQPEDRLGSIVRQISPVVILTSIANQDLARRLVPHQPVVVVGEQLVAGAKLPTTQTKTPTPTTKTQTIPSPTSTAAVETPLPVVNQSNTLYVVFTSGSTGAPKGVVVTHANITSAIRHQRETLGFTRQSRVYDFASYMFDVVWCNLLQGLSAGGCICIPSNDDRRNDPLGAITRLGANTAIFTPSTIRGLDLQSLKGLRHVHFIGEALSADDVGGLHPDSAVTNLYGPTECTTFSTAQQVTTNKASNSDKRQRIGIGLGLGLRTWLVQPFDHSKLVPLGCVGELLLEGPLVAAGYLGEEEKTATAFINDPGWLLDGTPNHPGRHGRLYKTGDLARYDADGTLIFLGRKDSQVKINGQRVELGDVEHHIQSSISHRQDVNVVAEVMKPRDTSNSILVAFIQVDIASEPRDEEAMQNELAKITAGLADRLLARVPAYMVPSAYIPLNEIPVTPTGKIDRRRLRAMGQQWTLESLVRTNLPLSSERPQPSTVTEKRLQSLWAAVLGLKADSIAADDSFLRIGGDSIAAMRLVAAAREQNLTLSVADVFQHPLLSDLATVVGEEAVGTGGKNAHQNEPFALLNSGEDLESLKKQIAAKCNVEARQVADAFPCTPLQEGLLALTAKRPGDYVARFIYPLLPSVSPGQFFKAWEAVVSATPILRTRITDLGERGLVQVIVDGPISWSRKDESMSLNDYEMVDKQLTTGLGTPMTRFAVLQDPVDGSRFFVWTIHHALYDGWSISLMLNKLEAAYSLNEGSVLPFSPPLQTFVNHIMDIDQSIVATYWGEQFQGSEAQIFPSLPSVTYQPMSNAFIKHRIQDLKWPKSDVTPSMVIRAAWSLLATKYTDSSDTVFGVTVSGRQARVLDVERIIGPTIATVPVRVAFEWTEMTVEQFLRQVQTQAVEMTEFEQTGLQRIRRVSAEAERACGFQTLLVVHPVEDEEERNTSSRWFISRRDENGEDDTNVTEYDTHALTIECSLERQGLRLRTAYDANILDVQHIKRLATQLEHIIRQLCIPENASKSLSSIDMVSAQDMRDIWEWNNTCPEALDACLHDMISKIAQILPDALAVNAWDGDFTYRELNDLSTRLASYLVCIGVGPETIIPLYFEKSKWTPIAMLAVMKAGGASVLMDSRQPQDRLRAIIDQVKPVVVVSSSSNAELASKLTNTPIVIVSSKHLERICGEKLLERLPQVQPWNKAYLIFTSGSTGIPKGAILTHANVCSAVRYQQLAQGYTPDARVYDFTSYAFDTAWNNFIHTFTIGACLCIPSESERRDDLAGSIERFKPTILDITPSAATTLQHSTIQSLRTLILGGERLSAEYSERWRALVDLKLCYGPCECTPTATVATIDRSIHGEPTIGRGIGMLCWIADAKNHNILVPIGATGELVLEGPLVGHGYLGDEAKTSAVFIHNPPWLLRGRAGKPGRNGRLYKTGDLVRYNSDGTLLFVGRKDAQVKINGQRVELGEVENHMARHPLTRQSASLYPHSGPCAKKLVGVFSLESIRRADNSPLIELVGADGATAVQGHIHALQGLLGEALPSYMIPSIWVALKEIPLNPSGKLNRRAVEDWLLRMDSETFSRINNTGLSPAARKPKTDSERILCDACSVILNTPLSKINLQRSFVANGGDSISAMRLSSYCRVAGLIFSVSVLLKRKSLADVAQLSTIATDARVNRSKEYREDFDKAFTLSPIQKWFFAQTPSEDVTKEDYYCNQGFYVKVFRPVLTKHASLAIDMIVKRHSMLRARFERSNSGWMQRVPKPIDAVYHFGSSDAQSIHEIKASTTKSHKSLDIERGLVFAADLYNLPSGDQYLTLIAHHLVVDLVSWRIILDDLETLLTGKKILDSFPFQVWSELQTSEAQSSKFAPDRVLSTKNVHNNHTFWNFTEHTSNTATDHIEKKLEVDKATTALLLKDANTAFNTEPIDLILSSIWDAFFYVFPEREGLTIFNEGHGREPWTTDVDLSCTVGWFTTISPIHISRSDGNSRANISRLVKDARRQLPANGWAYWVSRHLNDQGIAAFESHASTMEVQFNYHGQFQQLERSDSLFEVVNFDDSVSQVGPLLPTSVLFDINVVIEAGITRFSFSWNRHLAHQDLIQAWTEQINPSLQAICFELSNRRPERTLCDYEFLNLDYRGLDELHGNVLSRIEALNDTQVENIYPSSPMVDGILLSQMKGTGSYETSQTWEIRPRGSHVINVGALADAWQAVVARHPSLRTVFIHSMDASAAFNSVVLKSCRGDVVLVESNSLESTLDILKELPSIDYTQDKPAHRLVLCTVSADNRVICKIEMSHAISDGASTAITMQDWAKAYSGELNVEELRSISHGFSRTLMSVSKADRMAYWKKKLSAMEPCHFPRLAEAMSAADKHATGVATLELGDETFHHIQRFCEAQSITPASLFQSAWALTLSAYTGSDSVCFGYLSSGRDFPVKGIMESIGAFANVMICRTDISREWSGQDLISHVHNQVLEDLGFQHCSIADIQHELGLPFSQNLFNSIISFQRDSDSLSEGMVTEDLVFADLEWEDPTEYDITISIRHTDTLVCFTVDHRLSCVSNDQARSVVSLLEKVVKFLVSDDRASSAAVNKPQNQLSAMENISERDLQDIWRWNKTVPEDVHGLVHDIIANVAQKTPYASAICAWDGDLSYTELNGIATKLAHHLVTLGIGPDVIVPLYFEKSKWMPVAMLAVMKAGGASVALDRTLPEERLRSIIQQVNPVVILTSAANEEMAKRLADCVTVPVSDAHLAKLSTSSTSLPDVKPINRLYIVFTSGSTGVPKGVVITHSNFCSAVRYQQQALGFTSTSRVYDFVKYAFDVTWSNFLHTMTSGACLCIPSEDEASNNITGSLISYKANFADLTPSVASTLRPADLTTLDHLLFSGEALTTHLAAQWAEQATVLNTYGPAECSVKATFAVVGKADASAASIGSGFGMCTWVVHPNNHNMLVPIGVVGELLLEGPLVGAGYLDDAAKTQDAFIENPAWLVDGTRGRRGRLYKTGDLVRYNIDGSMTFIGRKDAQVKINGQRLELGDVEHHVCNNIAYHAPVRVFAEVIKPQQSDKSILMAFIHVEDGAAMTPSQCAKQTTKITAGLNERLSTQIPSYMIPSTYLLLDEWAKA
ncbi:nonribosomal peptide synthase, partial [Metarhizium majus ARSEF 297]